MTYYSCHNFLTILFIIAQERLDELIAPVYPLVDPEGFEPSTFSMPLRRAPNCAMGPHYLVTVNTSFQFIHCSLPSGPEGIRTPGLLSAIEARSQLRYRPICKAKDILLEAVGYVKQSIS